MLKHYEVDGVLDELAPSASYDRLTRMLGLIRGRMLLLSQGKRTTTRVSYAAGRKALQSFTSELSLRPLPLTPALLMDWAVHGLTGQELDSSTIKVRFGAAFDIYDYARTRLGLQALANPLRDAEVLMFGKILGTNYKKKSKARRAITITIMRIMLEYGWNLRIAHGCWGRLRWTFLNLGMLRVGGANKLIIVYTIETAMDGSQTVVYDEDSDVQVLWEETLDEIYSDINVDLDKNVNSSNRRHAYIPGNVAVIAQNFCAIKLRTNHHFRSTLDSSSSSIALTASPRSRPSTGCGPTKGRLGVETRRVR